MGRSTATESEDGGTGKKGKWQNAAALATQSSSKYVPEWAGVEPIKRRLVGASAAKQKRGKTRFGFTMPKPLAYLQLDASGEYMLAEARKASKKKDDIKHLKYFADPRGDIKSANLRVFESIVRDFEYCVSNFRSVLVDTVTELLDVRKLAEYGRNSQILQIYYGSIYADLRWLVKEARQHDANVWFVHRVKDEYIGGDRTGNDLLDGWRGIQYEAQVYAEHDRTDDGVFTTTIKESEQNALVTGMVLSSADDENDFPTLASRVFGTDMEDWQ